MTAGRGAHRVLLSTLGGYLCFVLVRASSSRSLVDVVVGNIACAIPVVVLVVRARRHPEQRRWAVPLALGIALFGIGVDLSALQAETLGALAYLAVYPLLLTAILSALRGHLRGVGWIVALDGLIGGLAGAAVAASVVSPIIADAWDGSTASAVGVVYLACDVLLVAAALGALGVVGAREGRHFALWAMGMLAFAVGDVLYAYLLAQGSYGDDTWLASFWGVGCFVMALGAIEARVPQTHRVPGTGSLAVVSVAATAAIAALVLTPMAEHGLLPTGLAVLTLGGCGARFVLAFRQLRELAAVRVLSLTDELTGVANRRALHAELDRLLRPDPRAEVGAVPAGFALLLVDLDHFKEVNDSFGHAAGDELLRVVVSRFGEALATLGTPHLLGRLGGDEFAVVLPGTGTATAATACGTALTDSLQAPIVIDGVGLHVRASIGVTVAPEHGRARSDLLFAADAAMYAAKLSGRSVTLYSPSGVGDRRQRLTVAEDLYGALADDELVMAYQPVVAAAGGVVGVEALVRWDHPTRGRLLPGEFLDVAERYRLTLPIAERVLEMTLADLSRWRSDGHLLRASVNVSASDLSDDGLVGLIASALVKHDVAPSALTVEITENAMMRDPDNARAVMTAIADLGVRLSVDDYGTGYCSLEYLLRLPIDEIKLDRAFSVDLTDQGRSVAIVQSTIDLTHALGLHMVAEGVEDAETHAILCDLGCDLMQGWHFGRPMSAAAFEAQLAQTGCCPPGRGARLTENVATPAIS